VSAVAVPPIKTERLRATHRLIPTKYSRAETVLSRLTADAQTLHDLLELDGATNDRLLGESGLLPGITVNELIFGVPYAHIVNAAFTHASPDGGRFNDAMRGAWYAGLERRTSVAEVAFHKLEQLAEVSWPKEEISNYDDYLADISADLHDLRGGRRGFTRYLAPEPIPACYAEPQALAATLLKAGSSGIVYPSVRLEGGTCVVCFRPALVSSVRRGAELEVRLLAGRAFTPSQMRVV